MTYLRDESGQAAQVGGIGQDSIKKHTVYENEDYWGYVLPLKDGELVFKVHKHYSWDKTGGTISINRLHEGTKVMESEIQGISPQEMIAMIIMFSEAMSPHMCQGIQMGVSPHENIDWPSPTAAFLDGVATEKKNKGCSHLADMARLKVVEHELKQIKRRLDDLESSGRRMGGYMRY